MRAIRFAVLVIVCCFAVTCAARVLIGGAAPPQTVVNGGWLVDIRTICAVGGIVLIGTWRLSWWMKAIEERLKTGEDRFTRIEASIAKLPCDECTHRKP